MKNSEFEYRRNLPHYQRALQPLFVTFSTIEGFRLKDEAKDIVFNACQFNDGRLMDLHAMVVMSTHAHLLFHMRFDADLRIIPLRKLTHSIKSFTSHEINKAFGLEGSVWQDESFDHVVRNEISFEDKLLYIRMNPVKAGLAKRAEDYKWFWQSPAACSGQITVRTKKQLLAVRNKFEKLR